MPFARRWYTRRPVDLLTTLITTGAGAGATYVVTRVRRHRQRRIALASRIGSTDVELPLDTRHLTPRLGALAVGARTVRLVLETPLRRFDDAVLQESPWRLRERLGEYDLALGDARLVLWQWLRSLARLDGAEIEVLRQLGLDPRPLRALIYKPGIFDRAEQGIEDSIFPSMPDFELVLAEIGRAMDTLRRFEVALLSHRGSPYR